MARTLEEIQAIHEARAAKQVGKQPAVAVDDGFEDDGFEDDGFDEGNSGNPTGADVSELENEIARLREQLSATQGRVAPEQRRAEEFRQFYETERQARERETRERDAEIAALRDQLDAANSQSNLEELLTPEERDQFDPSQLAIMAKLADAAVKRRAPRINVKAEALQALQEREAQHIEDYRTEVLTDPTRGLASLGTLAHDPAFIQWVGQEENDDFDALVNTMLQARSVREIDRYAKAVSRRITKFKEQGKSKTPATSRPTDARTSLAASMQRRPRRVTNEEMNNQLSEVRRLSKSRHPADRKRAKDILDSLN